MTEKKIPTVEQLNDFIEEYDLYTKVFEESGKMGVKGFIDSKGAFTTDEE